MPTRLTESTSRLARLTSEEPTGETPTVLAVRLTETSTPTSPAVTQTTLATIGPAGLDGVVPHTYQFVDSAAWMLPHNLGREPMIDVIVDGEPGLADVTHIDLNNSLVEFPQPTSGKAVLI